MGTVQKKVNQSLFLVSVMFPLVLSGDMLYIFIDSLWPERKEVAVFAFLNYDFTQRGSLDTIPFS